LTFVSQAKDLQQIIIVQTIKMAQTASPAQPGVSAKSV
jgi:hypothetical protein